MMVKHTDTKPLNGYTTSIKRTIEVMDATFYTTYTIGAFERRAHLRHYKCGKAVEVRKTVTV